MTDPPSEAGMNEALTGSTLGENATKYVKDHNITVVFDTTDGSYWDAPHNRIVVNAADNQDAGQILVHEANHAENNAASDAAWNGGSKTNYVDTMIHQETQGTVESIQSNQELRDAGKTPPHTFPLENEYKAARDKAIVDYQAAHPDATPADVAKAGDDAGYARVKLGFENGEVKASTNGQSYKDYYGNSYDTNHPTRPPGGP